MKLTPKALTAREDAILDALEFDPDDTTFLRKEVSDEQFRSLRDGQRQEPNPSGWWNRKAGMFAHAVAAALDGKDSDDAFADFTAVMRAGGWNHEVVNRFAYIQIKKVGGGGTSSVTEICEHATRYGAPLRSQVHLYQPNLVIGCGVGKASPARLLLPLLEKGSKNTTAATGAKWWKFEMAWGPMAVLQLYHPAMRGSSASLYEDVWASVRDVVATSHRRFSK